MSNIKAKIEKVLAKAKGTDNEAEAAVFLAKAEAMMEEHQITLLDLGDDDPMGQFIGMTGTPSSPTWQRHLMSALAQYYGATTVRTRRWRDGREIFELSICGSESARVTTELMYPFVLQQVREQGRKSAAEMGLKPAAATRRVANALVHNISRMVAEKAQAAPRTEAAAKNALVTVEALDAWMDENWPNLGKARRSTTSTNATARAAAGRVSLHRQAGGSATKRITG